VPREVLWKLIPWRKGLTDKETAKIIKILEDEGYHICVTTIEDVDNGLMCCLLIEGEAES